MEDIRKMFIVDEKEFTSKNSEEIAKKIINFVRVSKEGKVFIEKSSMKNIDKIGISLTARFVANMFEKSIPAEMSTSEISEITGLPQEIVSARLSELIKKRFIQRIKSGIYTAIPYRINVFVEKINKTYGGKNG